MTEQEIKKGIHEVCTTSAEIATLYADNNALVAKLNTVPQDELEKISNWYSSRSGVIINLIKDVLSYLKSGNNLDFAMLEGYVIKHKTRM